MLGAAVAHVRTLAQAPPPQAFRTSTDVVLVDVSVMDRGQPVTGLTADDFVLTDNGVRQQIDSVEPTAVPVDLTLVLDVSGNPRSPWGTETPLARITAAAEAEVARVAGMLRPGDRLRVLAVGTDVQQLLPMQEVTGPLALQPLEAGGRSALYDTLATALLHPVEPARRHVVIARTKGVDTISSVDAQAVRAIAERADAVFHVVAMESAADYDSALRGFQCRNMGYCWPTRRFWIPFERRLMVESLQRLLPDGEAIVAAADATGGGFHQAGLLRVPTLTGVFTRAFEAFRSGYVLRYTPRGVAADGWHDIEVRVSRSRSSEVRARRGYLIERPAPAPEPLALPEVPRTVAELTHAYEAGAYDGVVRALRAADNPLRLLHEFDKGGNPWPASPRREAVFALELAEPAVFSANPRDREAGDALLIRFSRLVRQPLAPDLFERYWYFAALTLLEGTVRPEVIEAFADRALARFPAEGRFMLSRAIAAEQRLAARLRRSTGSDGVSSLETEFQDVRSRYLAAMALPAAAAEARVRLAWLEHGRGEHAEALAHLEAASSEAVEDPALRYLRHLVLGHVLNALDRRDAALAAFRDALAIIPTAQSARVALMNTRLLLGDTGRAEALAEAIQRETDATVDPWWLYRQGQYRLQQAAMAQLREMIQ